MNQILCGLHSFFPPHSFCLCNDSIIRCNEETRTDKEQAYNATLFAVPLCSSMPSLLETSVQHRQQSLHYILMRKTYVSGNIKYFDRLIKTLFIFLPPSPLPSRKQNAQHRSKFYTIYSYEKKKTHMYQGTLNILDMLRKLSLHGPNFSWRHVFLLKERLSSTLWLSRKDPLMTVPWTVLMVDWGTWNPLVHNGRDRPSHSLLWG